MGFHSRSHYEWLRRSRTRSLSKSPRPSTTFTSTNRPGGVTRWTLSYDHISKTVSDRQTLDVLTVRVWGAGGLERGSGRPAGRRGLAGGGGSASPRSRAR